MKYLLLPLMLLSFVTLASENDCSSAKGIDLGQSPGSYASLWPRNQGSLGTCYAHSATDLLSSFLGLPRLNVYDAAINSGTEVAGGDASDVMEEVIKRGWACEDYGQFSNLFPSQNKNIMTDLMDAVATSGMPVFYTGKSQTPEGAARQKRIAELAGKIASGEVKPCSVYLDASLGLSEFHRLKEEISRLEDKIKTLNDEKDAFDGWFGTRESSLINKDIAQAVAKKNKLNIKSDKAHDRYIKGTNVLDRGQNFLDNFSEQEAAEIVYYWAEKTYPSVKAAFEKYGLSSWAPSMKQYIIEKVKKDPVTGHWIAGALYPYHLIKRVMANSCQGGSRISVPMTIKTKTMFARTAGASKMTAKVDSLLVKKPGQGIGISVNSSILQSTGSGGHSVNIIGCRTVGGTKEYLIHNSWGSDCNSYHTRYRSADKCQGGRVWIPASIVINSATEIQWLEK